MILMRSFYRGGEKGMWRLVWGCYRCAKCYEDMVVLELVDDDEPRLVYKTVPIACPKCHSFMEAAQAVLEETMPELFEDLKRFYF